MADWEHIEQLTSNFIPDKSDIQTAWEAHAIGPMHSFQANTMTTLFMGLKRLEQGWLFFVGEGNQERAGEEKMKTRGSILYCY